MAYWEMTKLWASKAGKGWNKASPTAKLPLPFGEGPQSVQTKRPKLLMKMLAHFNTTVLKTLKKLNRVILRMVPPSQFCSIL